jgi:VWFA-related protein
MHGVTARLTAVLVGGTVLFGQQTSTPIFRGGAAMVRVDVRVLDHSGKPVSGLQPDDFEISLDGRVQKVVTLDYEATSTTGAVNAHRARDATNATPARASRLVVVLVDDLSMAATNNRDLFHAASRFVASLPDTDLVGFTTTSGQAALNPTRDHGAVEVGLRRAVGKFNDLRTQPPDVFVGLNEAVEIDGGNQGAFARAVERECLKGQKDRSATVRDLRSSCADDVELKAKHLASEAQRTTELQMATYKAVINAMRPFEGERALLILSEGVMMSSYAPLQAADIKVLERAGATAGVHVSVLSPEPDFVSMTTRSADEAKVVRDDGQALMRGIENVAGAAGGDFYRLIGQPDRFFGFVADAMSSVYHLGVEAPPGTTPGKEFKLSARVKRTDVTVRANRVALHDVPAAPVPVDTQLQAVVTRGDPKYGVPIAIGTLIRPGKTADEITLGVNVEVPAGVPGPLTMLFAAVDERGRSRTGRHTLSARAGGGDYRLSFSLPMPAASYRLRIGVADAQGQVGGLDMPVAAQLNQVGPFRASDILVAWTGADGRAQFLSLGRVPAVASRLLAGVELVPAAGAAPRDVRVTWTISTESGKPVTEQTVTAVVAQDRLNAQTQFPMASLAAGTYELRATILVANQAAGSQSTTFRKADD